MKLRIIKNTYPVLPNIRHGEEGDIVHWALLRGCYSLLRESDGESVFASADVNKDGLLRSNGKPPVLVGTVARVKSRGWCLILEEVQERDVADVFPDTQSE